MAVERKSIFKRGAEQGAMMGLYLSVLFLCMVISLKAPLLGVIAMVMILGVPFVTYYFLRRSYVSDMGMTKFSELWTQGIIIFACGSLIMAAVSLIYTKFIEPNFIFNCMNSAIEILYESDPSTADMFQRILDQGKLPSAADFAMEYIWLGIFSGSIVSMLMALLVIARKVKDKRLTDNRQ